jgi:hypothetical protein
MQTMMCIRTNELDVVKEFYNQYYGEIYEVFFPKDLLKLPDVVSGYFLDPDDNKITK